MYMLMMKRYVILFSALVAFCGCRHDIVREMDFNVLLSEDNTYVVGEPVKFDIKGNVDNILFYSGEPGCRYTDRNLYEVQMDSTAKIKLSAEYQVRYGSQSALEVWVSGDYDGLGECTYEDSVAFAAIAADPAAKGWKKLPYDEGKSGSWTAQEYDISEYLKSEGWDGKFCLAFHWCPTDGSEVTNQRGYWLNGNVDIEIAGRQASRTYKELGFKSISMNEDTPGDALKYNGCSVQFNVSDAEIFFSGKNAAGDAGLKSPYKWDMWIVSTPVEVFPVEPYRGEVIKDIQNYLETFEYTFGKPGTYTVTFVATNSNYAGASKDIVQMQVVILDTVE